MMGENWRTNDGRKKCKNERKEGKKNKKKEQNSEMKKCCRVDKKRKGDYMSRLGEGECERRKLCTHLVVLIS